MHFFEGMKVTILSLMLFASAAYAMPNDQDPTQLEVSSPAFNANAPIPAEYTCDGAGTAPALNWTTPPAGTRTVALLAEDTDGPNGVVTHWLVTNINPRTTHLAKGGATPNGAFAANNDKGKPGYMGPCPSDGTTHHYHFHVYALDTIVKANIARSAFESAIQGHVLAQGELVGTFEK